MSTTSNNLCLLAESMLHSICICKTAVIAIIGINGPPNIPAIEKREKVNELISYFLHYLLICKFCLFTSLPLQKSYFNLLLKETDVRIINCYRNTLVTNRNENTVLCTK